MSPWHLSFGTEPKPFILNCSRKPKYYLKKTNKRHEIPPEGEIRNGIVMTTERMSHISCSQHSLLLDLIPNNYRKERSYKFS